MIYSGILTGAVRGDETPPKATRSPIPSENRTMTHQPHLKPEDEAELEVRPHHSPSDEGHEKKEISLFEDKEKKLYIGDSLQGTLEDDLKKLLARSRDVFAWTAQDLAGVPADVAMHSLRLDPSARPVVQQKRKMAPEKAEAASQEIKKLLRAGFKVPT